MSVIITINNLQAGVQVPKRRVRQWIKLNIVPVLCMKARNLLYAEDISLYIRTFLKWICSKLQFTFYANYKGEIQHYSSYLPFASRFGELF
jgi:hypothetical protein